jgi:hypothetical protein
MPREKQPWERPGHACIADEYCPCGHWEPTLRPINPWGTRPKISLDVYEKYSDQYSGLLDH